MAHWDNSILGGDGPQAIYHDVLVEVCNINLSEFDVGMNGDLSRIRAVLQQHINAILVKCTQYDLNVSDYCPNVALLVVGEMLMSAGCNMDGHLKSVFFMAAIRDIPEVHIPDQPLRSSEINAFITRLCEYPETKLEPKLTVDLHGVFT